MFLLFYVLCYAITTGSSSLSHPWVDSSIVIHAGLLLERNPIWWAAHQTGIT